jgi:class 3 adenylate cyclase
MPMIRAHYFVLRAGLRLLEKRYRSCEKDLDRAEKISQETDHPWVSFQAAYLRAHLLERLQRSAAAQRSAISAHMIATENGWLNQARRIRHEFQLDHSLEGILAHSRSSLVTNSMSTDANSVRLKRQMDALLQVSLASVSVLDPDQLARIALSEIIRIFGAERAFLFFCKENGEMQIKSGRDQEGKDLKELTGFSSSVVEMVRTERKPVVVSGSDSGSFSPSESIVTHNLKSILAVPLLLKDRLIGVVYLDNRLAKGVFTDEDVEVLMAIANHIAVSLETARAAELELQRRKMKNALDHYLSPEVLEQVLHDPSQLELSSDRKELTVLFSDVRNFSEVAEMLSPEQLSELMNAYFTPMTQIIMDSRGTVDKFIGDALMAFWGAPIDLADHADRAAEVGLKMQSELEWLNARLREKDFPALRIGIGISTGTMAVGNMGSHQRFNYTVLGEAVNLGARLERLTKNYKARIILSERTYASLTRMKPLCRDLDDVRVKGKAHPLRIYELMSPEILPENMRREFLESFNEGRKAYRAQDFASAKKYFSRCARILPFDFPSRLYLKRTATLALHPPGEEWDGVSVLNRK